VIQFLEGRTRTLSDGSSPRIHLVVIVVRVGIGENDKNKSEDFGLLEKTTSQIVNKLVLTKRDKLLPKILVTKCDTDIEQANEIKNRTQGIGGVPPHDIFYTENYVPEKARHIKENELEGYCSKIYFNTLKIWMDWIIAAEQRLYEPTNLIIETESCCKKVGRICEVQ